MKAFIVISDRQVGHKQGCVSPDSELEEGVPIPFYPIAESLWDICINVCDWVDTNYKKAEKYIIDVGETTQGNKFKDDLLTAEMHLQFKWAAEGLDPFLKLENVKAVRFMQATSWHEYGDGSSSKLMKELIKYKYPKVDVKQMNQYRALIGDTLLEFTHHGSATSKRKYLEGNSAFLDAKDRIINHLVEGKRCPDLTFTAHTHKPSMATASILQDGKYVENTQVITSPMCGPGCYSRKVANPSMYYVGMNVVITDGIGYKVVPFYKRLLDYELEVI